MNDPKSFSLESLVKMKDGSLCFTYRARNAFNALRLEQAVITKKQAKASSEDGFVNMWNRYCGGKTGEDLSAVGGLAVKNNSKNLLVSLLTHHKQTSRATPTLGRQQNVWG